MARKKKDVEEVIQEEVPQEPTLFDIISTHSWHPADAIATIIEDEDNASSQSN